MTIEQLRSEADRMQDPKYVTRLIANVATVEEDFFLLSGPLSERLMTEIVSTLTKAVVAPWQINKVDWAARITCPDWKMSRGVGTGDAWLELAEICADDDSNHSWLAAALRAGGTQMGIELIFRPGLVDFADKVIGDDKAVAPLWERGFWREEDSARLFIPVVLNATALAKGFAENDFAVALAPVAKAMEQAITGKAELDALVERVRAAAKRS